MKSIRILAVLGLAILQTSVFADDDESKATLVKVGDIAPDFTCQPLSGKEFSLGQQKGKVVLVNFFATWCGPCMEEMPHLDKDVFKKFSDRSDFAVIAIGREHTAAELEKLRGDKGFALPIAPDPKRQIYAKYATQYIPRNFVIGRDGKVKVASMGYTPAEFEEMVRTIERELKQESAAK
jgi:peroxiredoxin